MLKNNNFHFLMKYDMGLIFICLFAMHMSLRRCLLKSLAYLLFCFVVLLHFKGSLCNLDNNSLFDVYFANIFFHPEKKKENVKPSLLLNISSLIAFIHE